MFDFRSLTNVLNTSKLTILNFWNKKKILKTVSTGRVQILIFFNKCNRDKRRRNQMIQEKNEEYSNISY